MKPENLCFSAKLFNNASPANIRALVESEYFYDTYGDFIEGLNKCGSGDENCRADQHADFVGDDDSAKTVCLHIANCHEATCPET